MQQLNEKSHYATVISSLNKEYKKTKVGKSLTPNDIYLLDIIYNLLNGCCLELSNTDYKKLLNIYNNILFTSKVICNSSYQEKYQMTKDTKFIQAKKTDCNDTPIQSVINKIYYWQEESYLTTIQDIKPLTYNNGYFLNKSFDNYNNFKNIGKTISYSNLGRICFYATESDNKKFIITDLLNNDVTDTFNIEYLITSNATLIVAKNFDAPSDIFFKIEKTNVVNQLPI